MQTANTLGLLVGAIILSATSAIPVQAGVSSGSDMIKGLGLNLQQGAIPDGVDTYTPPVDGIHDGKVSMDFRPLKNRCFKFAAGDSLLTWEAAGKNPHLGMDGRCYDKAYIAKYSSDPNWKCASGYPFYRWKALEMTEDLCNEYCLGKGMDAFAFVHDSTRPDTSGNMAPESECRCGATQANTDIWGGTEVPAFLLPPADESAGGKTVDSARDGECDVEAFVYAGTLEDGSVSTTLMFPTVDDESYIDSIVAGCKIDHTRDNDEADGAESADGLVPPAPSSICDDAAQQPRAGYAGTNQVVEFQKAVFGGALTANVQSHVQLMSRTGKVTDSCYPKSCGPIGAGQLWSERIKDPASPWQESVVVRFYFLPGTDDARKDVYRKAATAIYKATCIKVTEFANLDAVKDTKGYIGVGLQAGGEGTCYANMGEFKGSKINLGFCNSERNLGSVIHENLHAVGVNHEQKRPDGSAKDPLTGKGPHLNVDWDKMDPRWKSQWVGAPNSYVGSNDQGVGDVHSGYAKYDFDSLMHYGTYGGGKWDVKTIPAGMPTGQRSKIAESDSEQVNDMYQCLKKGDPTRPPVETCFDTEGATGITLGGKPATCADLTRYCNHADYIKKACPKTCGVCTPGAPASTPAPVTPSTPAPVTPSTPAPVTPSTSAPVTPSTPAPVTPSTSAPVTPSTSAPVTKVTSPPSDRPAIKQSDAPVTKGGSGGPTCGGATKFVGQCKKCVDSSQCEAGFCCPYMKLCVPSSRTGCPRPIANCRPVCHKVQCSSCSNKDYPNNWVTCPGGGSPSTKAPVTPSTGAPVTESCTDKRGSCPGWARKGYCTEKYVAFMTQNCAKSCGKCGGGSPSTKAPLTPSTKAPVTPSTGAPVTESCTDKRRSCPDWAKSGYCTEKYVAYMTQNCAKSCGKCGG